MEGLLIIGAGQFGMMVREIASETGNFSKIDFLDDTSEAAVGRISDMGRLISEYGYAICAIGNPQVRGRITEELIRTGYKIATVVSPRAYVSPSAALGEGVIIEPMAVVQKCALIGRGSIVSSGAVARHDCRVGQMCHLDCNCVVSSLSSVPDCTKVECLSLFKNN